MAIKKHIPNTITCLNLFSGCIATVMALNGFFFYALLFILLAAVFDFFDGMAARLLHTTSPIGKELDSLADMISFGLAPSTVVFRQLSWIDLPPQLCVLPYFAFLIAVFSALRLAKFNVDERQTTSFIGLPTPANALFFVGLFSIVDPLLPMPTYIDRAWLAPLLFNPAVVCLFVAIFSYLLVSEIPMFSLKFKSLKWEDNIIRYIFLILAVILLVAGWFAALPFIILLYLVISVTAYKK